MKLNYTILATTLLSVSASNAALFANGGFEDADLANDTTSTTAPTGWVISGTAGIVHRDGNFFGANIIGSVDPTVIAAFEGRQFVHFGDGGAAAGGTIAQTFDTIMGTTYTVEFSIAGGDFDGSSHQIIADAGGGLGGLTQAATNNTYSTHTFDFTATGTSTTLTFTDDLQSGGVSSDLILDGVSVTPIPEPSSTALLGLGGLALILRRRK